jgi:hypothetical protein
MKLGCQRAALGATCPVDACPNCLKSWGIAALAVLYAEMWVVPGLDAASGLLRGVENRRPSVRSAA